jgi:ABC-type uncharacterized transport system involved in gliding motility auxiliary subunit
LYRLLADAHLLDSRLSKLEGAGDLGPHIVEVVRNKEIVVQAGSTASGTENNTTLVPNTEGTHKDASSNSTAASTIIASADKKDETAADEKKGAAGVVEQSLRVG